jgi:hypothetical protein
MRIPQRRCRRQLQPDAELAALSKISVDRSWPWVLLFSDRARRPGYQIMQTPNRGFRRERHHKVVRCPGCMLIDGFFSMSTNVGCGLCLPPDATFLFHDRKPFLPLLSGDDPVECSPGVIRNRFLPRTDSAGARVAPSDSHKSHFNDDYVSQSLRLRLPVRPGNMESPWLPPFPWTRRAAWL